MFSKLDYKAKMSDDIWLMTEIVAWILFDEATGNGNN